jgi:hypothetical protein
MRPVVGFIVLHILLIGTGLSLLRAFRLLPARLSPTAVVCALGPAALTGVSMVIPIQIVLVVVGLPLDPVVTALVCVACALAAVSFWPRGSAVPLDSAAGQGRSPTVRWSRRAVAAFASVYLAAGAWAFSRLPTLGDDARIWSLKGLTLTYYHHLQPEIFQNQAQAGGHPIYPLFQPGFEAVLFQWMGSPELRLFHTELWLVVGAAIWTAGYLIARSVRFAIDRPVWLAALALLALTPAVVLSVSAGFADVTASVLLGLGALSLALWLERGHRGHVALAAVLLAAAANGKDEDLAATILIVLAAAGIVTVDARRRSAPGRLRERLVPLMAAAFYIAVLVLPWRLWTRAHHLTDAVQPPLPHALSPAFFLGRTHELHFATRAMLTQTLNEFGWLAAVFVVASAVCVITDNARRAATFYLTSFILIIAALLWLYTTTPEPLSFLIPTSMNRTVDVFMVLAALATSHLIAALMHVPTDRPTGQPSTVPS